MLFHGTGHSNIQAICTFNFDWRLTGSHGDVYGKGRPPLCRETSWNNSLHFFWSNFNSYLSLSGSYFARDAKYSSKFCHTTGKHNTTLQRHGLAPPIFASEPPYKTMFLARVLVGEYTVGHPMYCRPPSKDASFTNFYDSCVDDMANPKIYVIFDSNQIYPEYLIEFYWHLTKLFSYQNIGTTEAGSPTWKYLGYKVRWWVGTEKEAVKRPLLFLSVRSTA